MKAQSQLKQSQNTKWWNSAGLSDLCPKWVTLASCGANLTQFRPKSDNFVTETGLVRFATNHTSLCETESTDNLSHKVTNLSPLGPIQTLRKIAIWMSKKCQKCLFFPKKIGNFFWKNEKFWQFFKENVKFLSNFLTFKWQFSGGSGLIWAWSVSPAERRRWSTRGGKSRPAGTGRDKRGLWVGSPTAPLSRRWRWPSDHP